MLLLVTIHRTPAVILLSAESCVLHITMLCLAISGKVGIVGATVSGYSCQCSSGFAILYRVAQNE